MTDNESKYKAAFMALLDDYRKLNIDAGFDEEDFCKELCPVCETNGWCPATEVTPVYDDDGNPVDEMIFDDHSKCAEAIFNWYVENSND